MTNRDKARPPKRRNWTAAANPLLRKGGVHEKSRKSGRKLAKDSLRRASRRGFDSTTSRLIPARLPAS